MKYFLVLYLLILLLASCKSKNNLVPPIQEGIRIDTKMPLSGLDLSIRHELLSYPELSHNRPFVKTVRNEATNTSLTLEVDQNGIIQADCFSEPDTLTLTQYVYLPKPVPCPEPIPVPKKKSRSHWLFVAGFSLGFLLRLSKTNIKKLYDRLKTFISTKSRR